MALVVFLRGVNVGGHKTFRPSVLAKQLKAFDAVNIGAAGTFVIRKAVSQAKLRAALRRHLPFETAVMICSSLDIQKLIASDPFAGHESRPDIVPFISVLAKRSKPKSPLPLNLPENGPWGVQILSCQGPFAIGRYRREMTAIGHLGKIDKVFGVPVTTRNWNTIVAIARVLERTKPA